MRSSSRFAVVIGLILVCLVGLGATSSAAPAASSAKARQVKDNIHTLQIAVQSYFVDHGDLFPRFVSAKRFRALLRPYIDGRWPVNPYTHRPMRAKRTAGNFTYATFDRRDNYRLVGWGKQGRRIIVVP